MYDAPTCTVQFDICFELVISALKSSTTQVVERLTFTKDVLCSMDVAKYTCLVNEVAACWIHAETVTIFYIKNKIINTEYIPQTFGVN